MSVEISEWILEKTGAADELLKIINSYWRELNEHKKMELFYKIQPLLHKVINAGIEYMKERDAKPELTDEKLRQMMRDPKYWRDQDPQYVRMIENGFKKLYGNN